eukprot:524951_1
MHYSQLKIDLQIDNNDKNDELIIFGSKHENTEHIWTETISRNLKGNDYKIEVINIRDDSQHAAQVTLSVEWDTDKDTPQKNDPQLEMEIHFKDKLKQIHFTQEVQELCHLKNFPKIYVTGRYTD